MNAIDAARGLFRIPFPDLSFQVDEVLAGEDRVWLRLRMRGTHSGPFVRFDGDQVDQVVPPTGRVIDVEQIHLLRMRENQVVKHEALRDDLGMLEQLRVFPPGPAVARMAAWKISGRAAAAAREVSDRAAEAAGAANHQAG